MGDKSFAELEGLELRKLVAERILGYEDLDQELPHVENDVDDVRLVLNMLDEMGVPLIIAWHSAVYLWYFEWVLYDKNEKEVRSYYWRDESLPQGICRAALMVDWQLENGKGLPAFEDYEDEWPMRGGDK